MIASRFFSSNFATITSIESLGALIIGELGLDEQHFDITPSGLVLYLVAHLPWNSVSQPVHLKPERGTPPQCGQGRPSPAFSTASDICFDLDMVNQSSRIGSTA